MVTQPEKNNRRAYLLQRHYSQNRSDNYYLVALASGMALAGLLHQSAVIWGWTFATGSLFWSLYEFHGENIEKKYNEYFYGQESLMSQIQKEQDEQDQQESANVEIKAEPISENVTKDTPKD